MSDFPTPPPRPPAQAPGWGEQPDWSGGIPPPPPPSAAGARWGGSGLRPVGEFLAASFGLVGRAAVTLLPLLIVVAVPVVLTFIAADSALGLTDWADEFLQRAADAEPGQAIAAPTLDASVAEVTTWLTILVVVNLGGTVLVALAGLVGLWAAHEGESPGTAEILSRSARAFGPVLAVVLTALAAVLAATLCLVALVVVVVPLGVTAILAAFPLCVWLFTRLALAIPIAAIEHRGVSALGRSWQLTAGHGWGVLGRLVLFTTVLSIGVQVISAPLSLLAFFGSAALVVGTVFSFLVSLAASAVGQAGPIMLYADLVESDPAATEVPAAGWGQPI